MTPSKTHLERTYYDNVKCAKDKGPYDYHLADSLVCLITELYTFLKITSGQCVWLQKF